MPLQIVKNDITKMKVDAIVNAANNTLLGGGGVDGAIHRAAGEDLLKECYTLHGCETGQAKYTKGYNLPCKYVIHTVGPIWIDGAHKEKEYLINCYRNSLQLAEKLKCDSLAFPLISTGAYGYPIEEALKIAYDTINDYLIESEMQVYIVVYDKNTIVVNKDLYDRLSSYFHFDFQPSNDPLLSNDEFSEKKTNIYNDRLSRSPELVFRGLVKSFNFTTIKQEDEPLPDSMFDVVDESFQEMLFRKLREKSMTSVECYTKAGINRKLFSKICSNGYKTSKSTVILLALALELSIDEANEMLMKAGFAFSNADKSDVFIKNCFAEQYYDIYNINLALFEHDLKTLGS